MKPRMHRTITICGSGIAAVLTVLLPGSAGGQVRSGGPHGIPGSGPSGTSIPGVSITRPSLSVPDQGAPDSRPSDLKVVDETQTISSVNDSDGSGEAPIPRQPSGDRSADQ